MKSPSDRHEGSRVGSHARVSGNERGTVIESENRIPKVLENGVTGEGSGSGFVDGDNIRVNVGGSRVVSNVSEEDNLHGIDLVVDLTKFSRKVSDLKSPEMHAESNEKPANYDVELTEKEGHYEVSDLVWGKVKSHPWWPGLIFDPSASTHQARKYFKKDGFLIAYFGDKSFAWNESSNIKPFRNNFCKMDKQTNTESFRHAVDCALHEAVRRVEYGLACGCLPEDVFNEIKCQNVINAGIRKESSTVNGGDRFSTGASFSPSKFIQSVLDLAKSPFLVNRLEVLIVRGQLSAFYRWKGCRKLPPTQILDESDDDDLNPSKKVRRLKDLMANSHTSSADEEYKYKPKKKDRKRKAIQTNKSSVRIQSQTAENFLSWVCKIARDPMEKQHKVDSLIKFTTDFRNYELEMNSKSREDENSAPQMEVIEETGFTGVKDSYWTDRFIEIEDPCKTDSNPEPNTENSATALILKFTNLDSVPPVTKLNEIFEHYGALQEPGAQILKKKNCVKVVFGRRCDAETAFSSSGKFSIFGPALVSYCLDFSPTPRKATTAVRKQIKNEKGTKARKAMNFEK